MNLYNIYDSESGLCIGKKKTVDQIANLFGVSKGSIYQAAERGFKLNGKYKLEAVATEKSNNHSYSNEELETMRRWEEFTEKARQYFAHIRSKQRKFEQG